MLRIGIGGRGVQFNIFGIMHSHNSATVEHTHAGNLLLLLLLLLLKVTY